MPSSVHSYRSTSSLSYLPTPVTQKTCMTAAVKRYRYLRKLLNFEQMDFEFALWQMTFLFINPQKVYRNFQHRKETKSQFARDDPAFLVLLSGLLCISSIAFTFVLKLGIAAFFKFFLYIVVVDCMLSGVCISTLLWFITNKYLIKSNYKGQDVEWAYAFDVHLNAFVPMLVVSHIFQLFFYHIFLRHDWFLPIFIGNSLWVIAIGYYLYISFLGYSCLPIIKGTQILLIPFILLFIVYIVSLAANFNMCQMVMDFYHYRVL
ncbi:protein unc-50 homolog A [Daktulosphaira vitifoliae]|uniref:protein unc-50 homolog A n=1 Tax=Daktulosphaira vitifoliae TaxID=58002 RepID=UPI0021AA0E42|nr:protein unc-50 homolog A [Daktulosphaira vitifoliae]